MSRTSIPDDAMMRSQQAVSNTQLSEAAGT